MNVLLIILFCCLYLSFSYGKLQTTQCSYVSQYKVNDTLNSIVHKIIKSFNTSTNPFIEHVKFFENDKFYINVESISNKWSLLSERSKISTLVLGSITIQGANYLKPLCSYKYKWHTNDIMKALKHPCDTAIVANDGSINMNHLGHFIETRFKYDDCLKDYILTQSVMNEAIRENIKRDHEYTGYNYNFKKMIFLPTYPQVAQAEWDEFFNIYSDHVFIDENFINENVVTLKTFLEFYFVPQVLNTKILSKKQCVKTSYF